MVGKTLDCSIMVLVCNLQDGSLMDCARLHPMSPEKLDKFLSSLFLLFHKSCPFVKPNVSGSTNISCERCVSVSERCVSVSKYQWK